MYKALQVYVTMKVKVGGEKGKRQWGMGSGQWGMGSGVWG
jgi:hypothetical protein